MKELKRRITDIINTLKLSMPAPELAEKIIKIVIKELKDGNKK